MTANAYANFLTYGNSPMKFMPIDLCWDNFSVERQSMTLAFFFWNLPALKSSMSLHFISTFKTEDKPHMPFPLFSENNMNTNDA